MDWYLKYKLRKLSRKADPDKEFVLNLDKRLGIGMAPEARRIPVWRFAMVPVLVGILAVSTTGAYAYASEGVLPGNALYPVKQGLEKIEEKITLKPQAKALVAIRHLERRLYEDTILFKRNKRLPKARLNDFRFRLDILMDQIGRLNENQRTQLDERLATLADGYRSLVTEVSQAAVDANEKVEMDKAIDSNDESLEKKIEAMDAKRQDSFKHLKEKTRFRRGEKRAENK